MHYFQKKTGKEEKEGKKSSIHLAGRLQRVAICSIIVSNWNLASVVEQYGIFVGLGTLLRFMGVFWRNAPSRPFTCGFSFDW
jgi:hypothetical protein